MKTAFAIAVTALGLVQVQLFAADEREPTPRVVPAARLPATSYPKVELPPGTIAAEQQLEAAPKVDAPRDRELEAAAEKAWAERPRPAGERREEAGERREQTNAPREDVQRPQQEKAEQRLSFAQARERMSRERHDRAWWDQRYKNIVRAGTGYYFLDAGYWYPAFGYNPQADTYAYDGPIYATASLTPAEEITTLQETLQADGYYKGAITGVLDPATSAAIAKFQTDNGLVATGAIDPPTVEALGLA